MISRNLKKFLAAHQECLYVRYKTKEAVSIEKLEQESTALNEINEDAQAIEEEIECKRNKSRLKPHHRNIVHDKLPRTEPTIWIHGTLRYARKMYGLYGSSSGVNPSLCWPTKTEIADKLEYERVTYPFTIPQIVKSAKENREQKEKEVQQRQQSIAQKLLKLEQWKTELRNKITKQEAALLDAKDRKARLVEEVRQHFGYTVDPKDEKFKEMLEKKEKEQKKAMKEMRKKSKEEKMMKLLLNKQIEGSEPQTDEPINKKIQ